VKTEPEVTKRVGNAAFDARWAKALKALKEEQRETVYLVSAEVLFILLPFVAIAIVFSFKGKFHELGTQPEWALAASVISGQAIVKFIAGFLASSTGKVAWQKVSLGITLVIVISLTPSLLVLTLILNGEGVRASTALVVAQIILFFIGLLIFIYFGWLGEVLRAHARFDEETASPRRGDAALREPIKAKPSYETLSQPQKTTTSKGNNHYEDQAAWNQFIEDGAKAALSIEPVPADPASTAKPL